METLKHIDAAVKDQRGEIYNLFEGKLGHVALITSKKGSVRANHYHKEDYQYIYLVSGAYESHCCAVDSPEKKQVLRVRPGDIVATPPMIAHAQKFTEDSVFLAMTTREREDGKYENDTFAFQVTEGYINPNLKQVATR
ncbi:MAG: cupin domain-containing protein [Candidatus Omnitrophica bacterium]|nr:cupin domain-containing protein [Candidatus Omnitrophota bacterium]MDD5670086.1 cupin domain-containing protein [Candidatus Omnitrophota bacterium]